MFTIAHVFTLRYDVSRERTWAIEEWHHGRKRVGAKSSDAAFQLSLPVIHIHLASPRGLSCWFFCFFFFFKQRLLKNLISQLMTSLSCPCQSAFNLRDRRWQLTIGRGPQKIFYQAHSFILAYRWRNSETHKDTQKHRTESVSPPSRAQMHSSTISSQRDCTHSNKQRRRLLSECNYLVLSISLTAVGQRTLCWWGLQCVNRRLDILGPFHGGGHSICHPHIPVDLITLNKPQRERARKSQTLMALVLCVNPLLSACSLC